MSPSYADLSVRAVCGWTKSSGEEAPYFSLSDKQKKDLGRIADIIDIKKPGALIFAQGESPQSIYLVATGLVRSSHLMKNGERQVMAFLWPGDLFGLASDGNYVNSAETVTSSKIYRFPLREIETFLLKNPELHQMFLIKAVHDLRTAQRQILVMGRLDVSHRLAAFFLDCSGHETYFDVDKQILTLPMSHHDIADYLGTSPETITRALRQLESRSLVKKMSTREFVLSREALKSFVDLD